MVVQVRLEAPGSVLPGADVTVAANVLNDSEVVVEGTAAVPGGSGASRRIAVSVGQTINLAISSW